MKKRVLFVAYNTFNRGGIQNIVINIVKRLSNNYTFDLLCFQQDNGELEEEFLSYGGNIIKYKAYYDGKNTFLKRIDYYFRGFRIFETTKKAIRKYGPYQVIHCNNAMESGWCLLAAKLENIPVRISQAHTNFYSRENIVRRTMDFFYRKLMRNCSTSLIGCSEEACDALFGKSTKKIVLPNPYDCDRFNPAKYVDRKFPLPNIIQVASYSTNKNQLFSIGILKEVIKEYPEARLSFIGFESELGYQHRIKEFINENGMEKNVLFFPSDADIPFLLSDTPYFLFQSIAEGFGVAVVEAQAMGLRCFVSDTVPVFCDCGGCTFLPLSKGSKKWADEIIKDFRKNAGKHSKYNCEKFSISNVLQKYSDLYQGICEN